jgi:type I restriction enzyme S subunit
MELKPGYKRTEVGVIPEDWQVRAFSELGESLIGLTYKPSDVRSDGTLVLRSSNIQEGSLRFDDNVFVTSLVPERLMARPGDILICVRNGSRDLIGKCAHLDDRTLRMTFGAFMTVFRSDAHDFVYQQMQSQIVTRQIKEHLGATINQITNKSLNSFEIPLPPTKAEQQAITEALSDADALIESLEQLLGKKRQLKEGAMQELLTGKKRLPGFDGPWRVTPLGELGDCHRGVSYKPNRDLSEFDTNTTIRLLRSNNIQDFVITLTDVQYVNRLRVAQVQRLQPNDILICMANGSRSLVGKAALFQQDDSFEYTFGAFMGCFRPKGQCVGSSFAFHLFCCENYRKQILVLLAGSSIHNLTPANIESIVLPIPIDPLEQREIGILITDMNAEITVLEAKLAKVRQLKRGMMQELLTGRIRLVRSSAQVLPFPMKKSAASADVSHNTHFNEAVVIAVLSGKFGSENFPLGRFRRTKFSYLLHRHVEYEAAGFIKKAAGPYNPNTRYGGAEKIALHNRYVRVLSTGKSEGFVADENIAQAEGYFEKWYGAEALTWLEQFRYQKNDALELLTTVDMACEDLSRAGKAATLSAVKQIIQDSPEWKAKLNRAVFSDDNIATTIQSCGQLFPIEEE